MKKNEVNQSLVNVIKKLENSEMNYSQAQGITNAADKIIKNELGQIRYNKEQNNNSKIDYWE